MSPEGLCKESKANQVNINDLSGDSDPVPRQEAEWRCCAGGREAGRRARSEGTGTSLRDGPRSNTGRREPRQSRGRMSGWPSLWLLSLGQTRESDSAGGPKPDVSAHSAIGLAPKLQIELPYQSCQSGLRPKPHSESASPHPNASSTPPTWLYANYTHVYSGNITVTRPTTVLGNFCIDGRSILPTC